MGIVAMIIYMIMLFIDVKETAVTDFVLGAMLGIALGTIILSAIHTSRYGKNVLACKSRILSKGK